jgi:hypothetical protein
MSVNAANRELCFRLTLNPGQNPLSATISPSADLELWLEPTVAAEAMFVCPLSTLAQRNEEL